MDKKRLTLDFDATLQRRLKVVAALRGTSMRRYCEQAIEAALEKDEKGAVPALPFGAAALERLAALERKTFGEKQLIGDSADFVTQARDERSLAP